MPMKVREVIYFLQKRGWVEVRARHNAAMFENGQPLKPVVVSHVCYKLDAEIDRQASQERNKLLAPL
jgi:predicted RNA binding protein YcfA (HicA-like mRNA interferase family)